MSKYLFIESRDPFDTTDTHQAFGLATALSKEGNDVTLYLVQNGVLAARAAANALKEVGPKVSVLADDYSIEERGIEANELAKSVRVSDVDSLVDLLCEKGTKAIWH